MSSTGTSRSSFIIALRLVKNITRGKDVDEALTSLVSTNLTSNQIQHLKLKQIIERVKMTSANSEIINLLYYKIQLLEESEKKETEESKGEAAETSKKRRIQEPTQEEPVAKRQATSTASGATGPPTTSTISQEPVQATTGPRPATKKPSNPAPLRKPFSAIFGPPGGTPGSMKPPPVNSVSKPQQNDHNDTLLDFLASKKTAPVRFNPKKKPEVIATKPIPNENVAPSTLKKPSLIDSMFNDDEKRRRMERLKRQAESIKQKNAETENTLAELRQARQERIEEAQKAKNSGEPLQDVKRMADYNKHF